MIPDSFVKIRLCDVTWRQGTSCDLILAKNEEKYVTSQLKNADVSKIMMSYQKFLCNSNHLRLLYNREMFQVSSMKIAILDVDGQTDPPPGLRNAKNDWPG